MDLQEKYPVIGDDLMNKKVAKKDIDKYLLNFVARLVREVKTEKRENDDIGDGWSVLINIDEEYYQPNKDVYGFLFRLSDYGMQDSLGNGTIEYGDIDKYLE